MAKWQTAFVDLIGVLGYAAVCWGLYGVSEPLAFTVGGLMAMAFAYAASRKQGRTG